MCENKCVSNEVSRNVSLIDSIFDGSPGFHEPQKRGIPFFEDWLRPRQKRAEFSNILPIAQTESVRGMCRSKPDAHWDGEPSTQNIEIVGFYPSCIRTFTARWGPLSGIVEGFEVTHRGMEVWLRKLNERNIPKDINS